MYIHRPVTIGRELSEISKPVLSIVRKTGQTEEGLAARTDHPARLAQIGIICGRAKRLPQNIVLVPTGKRTHF